MLENCALLRYYVVRSGNSLPMLPRIKNLKMGQIGCPETSVRNYHYSLCKSPEDSSSDLLRGRSLKSGTVACIPLYLRLPEDGASAPKHNFKTYVKFVILLCAFVCECN